MKTTLSFPNIPKPVRLLHHIIGAWLALAASATIATAQQPGTSPVKIFIMAGQSNTEGHGEISPVTTQGTLEYITAPANDPTGKYQFLKNPGGGWAQRDDAWIHYERSNYARTGDVLVKGNLTAGYGVVSTTIGPELGFGHKTGDLQENQILIIKASWGGRSLGFDFLPPSSENYPTPLKTGDKGFYYKEILRVVNDAISNIGTYFPNYNGQGYQIAGFCWHQGYNDRISPEFSAAYQTNMANLIRDIRSSTKGLGVPNLPFVIATTGMGGETAYTTVELSQAKMADPALYPEFAGNVRVVDTRGIYDGLEFWQPVALSPRDQGYHWNRNAKTYLNIGLAMGDAMSFMVKPRSPYRLRATGGSGGVTLNWQNGTEIPTSVQILRDGVEIAAAAPTNTASYIDSAVTSGVHTYQLVFTMPVTPSAPLTATIDGGITGLQAFRIPGGVYLTWTNNLGYSAIEVRRDGTLIASSLSGSATNYVDASPPASGLVTYSVVPSTGSSSPATVQINLSAAPAGNAVIYEPFDYPVGVLNGKGGAEVGLSGTWTASGNSNVVAGSLTYGTLPTAGNSILNSGTALYGATRSVIPSALSGSGLLNEGSTLWFSLIMGYGATGPSNTSLVFSLSNSGFATGGLQYFISNEGSQLGAGLGVRLTGGTVIATQFRDPSYGTTGYVSGTPSSAIFPSAGNNGLIVGKISWGKSGDTIELYRPDVNMSLGSVISTLTVDVEQSGFDTLSWSRTGDTIMDEIRFGANYEDVIGASPTAAYWDLNGATSGAGGVDDNKPFGVWNTDSNWNPIFNGTGTPAAWSAGTKGVFAAGANATGAYTVTVSGTQDIGGLAVEEGTATLTGGTALRMTRNSTMDVKTGLTTTIASPISEDVANRNLSKEGAGTLVLSNSNNYSGQTSLYNGILLTAAPASLPGYNSAAKVLFKGGTLGVQVGGSGWTTTQVNTLLTNATLNSGSLGIDTTSGSLAQWTPFTSVLGLTKLGTNIFTLDQANTFTGPTRIVGGTLALAHNLALQNSVFETDLGGFVTMTGMSTPTFGGFSGSGNLSSVLGGYSGVTTLTLNPPTGRLAIYDGIIANGAVGMELVKTGVGTQFLRGANTFTGAANFKAGTLEVGGEAGSITTASAIRFNGGTLALTSSDTDIENAIDRVGNSTPIISNGGSLIYTARGANSSRAFSETLGAVNLLSGQLNIAQALNKVSGGQTLTLGSVTRTGSATAVSFSNALALDATLNRIKVNGASATPAGEIIGAWATTGTSATGQNDYARFDSSGNVLPLGIAASAETAWTSATANYTLTVAATTTLTASRTMNTLRYFGGNTPALALANFNLELNGFLCSSNGGAATFTISSTGGVIRQSGTAPANLYLTTGGRSLTITAPIQDNTGALSLVKSGSGGTLLLSGVAGSIAYSGDTIVNAGVLQVNSINANNETSSVSISVGAQLILNFSGNDTVQKLYIGGTRMPNGTYGRAATNGGFGVALDTYFGTIGAGKLTVTDNTAPTVISIVDNKAGSAVAVNTPVTYTVTFSDDMDASTVDATDFGNAGSSNITIGAITQLSSTVFNVQVTPTSTGTLQLRINSGAVLRDSASNALNTTTAIIDDTTLTVTSASPYATWSGGAAFDGDPNGDGLKSGLAWILGAADPLENAIALLPTLNNSDPNNFIFTFRRRDVANADPNITITVEYGSSLALNSWATASNGVNGVTIDASAVPAVGFHTVVVSIPKSLSSDGKLFAHLRVVIAP